MNHIREAIKQIEGGWKAQKIRLVATPLSEEDCQLLRETLKQHHTVKSLDICLCDISEEDILKFAQGLKDFGLVGLQLVHANMTERGARALATAIQQYPLKKLDVAFNRLGPRGAFALASALRDCGLEALMISRNTIRAEGAVHIAEVLAEGLTVLKTLDVTKNRIGDEGCIALANALPNTRLESLKMDTNQITHAGVVAVCDALRKYPSLSDLSLSENNLGDESIKLIAEVLPLTKMEKLTLNLNDFSDEAFLALADAIGKSDTMETLEVKAASKITDKAAVEFLKRVKTHRTFKELNLVDTNVPEAVRNHITAYLENLHSDRTKILLALCSAKTVPRIGQRSTLRELPLDLIRLVKDML